VGIVLLPLYTSHLTLSDYGVLSIFEITIMISVQFLVFGLPQSYLRLMPDRSKTDTKDSTLFTLFLALLLIGLLVGTLVHSLSGFLSSLFSQETLFQTYITISGWVIGVSIINSLFLSTLRAKEQSVLYITANLIKLTVTLSLNVLFITVFELGVMGILYAFLSGEFLLLLLLLPSQLKNVIFHFDRKLFNKAIRYGYPLIFSSLAHMLLNMGNNYILKLLVSYDQVGLYNLAYKVAGVLNVFIIQSFTLGFLPIAFKLYLQPGANRYFSKTMTYFTFALVWSGLALALFSGELVRFFSKNQDYWPAAEVVPILILSFVLAGVRAVSALGLYLSKETKYLARNTSIALAVSIALNFLVIPKWGVLGSAWATVLAFALLLTLTFRDAQRFYPIHYEYKKLALMGGVGLTLFTIVLFLPFTGYLSFLSKGVLLLLFPFLLYPFNFYEPIELLRIQQSWQKWRDPRRWKRNLKNK